MCNNTVYFVKNFDYRYLSSWAINYTNTFLQHMKHRIATLLHIILQWQCTLFFVNLNFFCSLICLVLYCTKRCRRALVTGIFHLWFRFQCTICLALKSLSEYNCMNIVISCLNKTTSNLLKNDFNLPNTVIKMEAHSNISFSIGDPEQKAHLSILKFAASCTRQATNNVQHPSKQ